MSTTNNNENNNPDGFDPYYDVILTGTDLISSLLSAALARIGKKVLHLDSEKHYGKEWRSMKLSDLILWSKTKNLKKSSNSIIPIDLNSILTKDDSTKKERLLKLERSELFENIEIDFHVFDDQSLSKEFFQHILKNKCTTKLIDEFQDSFYKKLEQCQTIEDAELLLDKFRDEHQEFNRIENMFVFDLCPRLLFSNEMMVKILIDSTVTRYIEFKKVSRLLTPIQSVQDDDSGKKVDDQVQQQQQTKTEIVEVPCTRSDIFTSTIISPLEKRYLMSFLEKCYRLERNKQWYEEFEQKTFEEFLKSQTLTEKLRKFIINTLLMTADPIPTEQALLRIKQFLQAFGRFCDRPFLFPLYGSEDIIQAFCRYGAVWGGLYCLGINIHGLIFDEISKKCPAALVNKSRIDCDFLITDYQLPEFKPQIIKRRMSRAIVLNSRSIKTIDPENDLGDLSFIHLPPEFTGSQSSIYCFESDYSSRVCPKDFYLQYFWCDSNGTTTTAKQDLKPIIEKLLGLDQQSQPSILPNELRNKILIEIYFNCNLIETKYNNNDNNQMETEIVGFPENVKIISTPMINEFNYESAVREALRLFMEMYPDETFFPVTTDQNSSTTRSEGDHKTNNDGNNIDPLDDIDI